MHFEKTWDCGQSDSKAVQLTQVSHTLGKTPCPKKAS